MDHFSHILNIINSKSITRLRYTLHNCDRKIKVNIMNWLFHLIEDKLNNIAGDTLDFANHTIIRKNNNKSLYQLYQDIDQNEIKTKLNLKDFITTYNQKINLPSSPYLKNNIQIFKDSDIILESPSLQYMVENPFVSYQLFNEILTKLTKVVHYRKPSAHGINIFIYSTPDIDFHDKYFSDIQRIINLFIHLIDDKTIILGKQSKDDKGNIFFTPGLTLNIFMSSKTKILPSINNNKSSFGVQHINGGSALPGQFINIWRREELIKVLIHELIHFTKIDIQDHHTKILNSSIQNKFTSLMKGNSITPNEAYTEFLAIQILSIFHAYKLQIHFPGTKLQLISDIILNIEMHFNCLQIIKILNNNNIKIKDIESWKNITFPQTTWVFSYFLIKTALLWNLKTNSPSIKKLLIEKSNIAFNNSDQNKKIMGQLMFDNYSSPSFVTYLQSLQNKKLINPNTDSNIKHINTNLRMSCLECCFGI